MQFAVWGKVDSLFKNGDAVLIDLRAICPLLVLPLLLKRQSSWAQSLFPSLSSPSHVSCSAEHCRACPFINIYHDTVRTWVRLQGENNTLHMRKGTGDKTDEIISNELFNVYSRLSSGPSSLVVQWLHWHNRHLFKHHVKLKTWIHWENSTWNRCREKRLITSLVGTEMNLIAWLKSL